MTVPTVVDGELIEAVWGNTVATDVNTHTRQLAGTQACGPLILPSANPTGVNQATRKGYVDGLADTKLSKGGGQLTGQLDMNNNFIIDLPNPTASGHAARKAYVDNEIAQMGATKVSVNGDAMTGDLNMNNHTVWGLRDPTAAQEAANKRYVDARVRKDGDTMTGELILPGPPTGPNHAATKAYVDGAVNALLARISELETRLAGGG
jgi:hypothetical protein